MKASLGILLMITGTEPCIAVCALLLAAIIYPVQFSKDIADGEITPYTFPYSLQAGLTTAGQQIIFLSNFSRGDLTHWDTEGGPRTTCLGLPPLIR